MTRKEKRERATLFNELKLMAIGAASGCEITDDEDVHHVWSTLGPEEFANWCTAIWRRWDVKGRNIASPTAMFDPWNLAEFATIEKATDHMYRCGARAGGNWA